MVHTDELQKDILRLEELDRFRTDFAEYRKFGREALKKFIEYADKKTLVENKWQEPKWPRHESQVVKALGRSEDGAGTLTSILRKLRKATITDIVGSPKKSPLFVESSETDETTHLVLLNAAYALDAIASAPEAAFSPATMYFYYFVVRELYYPTPPVWIVGGARAGAGGRPTAFATSQFVRAILSFARMLERTSQYVGALAEMQQTVLTEFSEWDERDAQRRALSLYTTLAQRSWNLAIAMKQPVPGTLDGQGLPKFEAQVHRDLILALRKALKVFETARDRIEEYREREEKAAEAAKKTHLIAASAGAHAIAFHALKNAVTRAESALEIFKGESTRPVRLLSSPRRQKFAQQLEKLTKEFRETAQNVRKLVRPALEYLSNVLDTQLAFATAETGSASFEPMEMAAAAATLGAAGTGWDDERLLRAAKYLEAAMGPDGFAISQPYHTAGGSTYYQPSQQQIVGAYAQILEHVNTELSPHVLMRIKRYFDRTRIAIDDKRSAWRWLHGDSRLPHSAYQTAISTITLDRLCRMLDSRINDLILRHFPPKRSPLRLQDLFYPDYGLPRILDDPERLPIAITLERMRAHVVNVQLRKPYKRPLYAVIFHGPPGTGKTTLLEALATSADVPLIEITPSDIVVQGTDAVEARARAVLRALSYLTRAVVIFDEFDQVLQTRGGQQPPSMLSFLTPNMLPKLKMLYNAAKNRQVAFALATNVVRRIDRAATREGRFDAAIGVYPPDLLSRYGRLFTEVKRYIKEHDKKLLPDLSDRFVQIVRSSKGCSMQNVGARGWFSRPQDEKVPDETIFAYLFDESATAPTLKEMDDDPPERDDEEDLWSSLERAEWNKIKSAETESSAFSKEIWSAVKKASFKE